jgi:hypothetical protein
MRNSHSLLRNSQPKEDSQYVSFQSSLEKYIEKEPLWKVTWTEVGG